MVTSNLIASLYALVNEFDFCVRQQIVQNCFDFVFLFRFALLNPTVIFRLIELLMDTIDVTEAFTMAESGVLEAAGLRKVPLKDWIFDDRFPISRSCLERNLVVRPFNPRKMWLVMEVSLFEGIKHQS